VFAEYLDEHLLLELPHRQFVFSIPKALGSFFRHEQKLFTSVSSLIFSLLTQFYRLAAGSPTFRSAAIVAFQPFGDFLRANAHWHALLLEGGFAPDGKFLFLPIHDTQKLNRCLPPCPPQAPPDPGPHQRGFRHEPPVLEKLGLFDRLARPYRSP
jgi:hypothetical protein